MSVQIEYNYDVEKMRLKESLSERYGYGTTREGNITRINFERYTPYLLVSMIIDNGNRLLVFYQWSELVIIWAERNRSR